MAAGQVGRSALAKGSGGAGCFADELREGEAMMKEEKKDIYARVTDTIVAQLEKGVRPWHQPWIGGDAINRPLRHNGEAYRGINVLMLWGTAVERGYSSPYWMTFRQAGELNARVRKGEKGTLVVYANAISRSEQDEETGEDFERRIPYLKGYTVFNTQQIEALPERYALVERPVTEAAERIAKADEFFAATGATIQHGGVRAYYTGGNDLIQMPPFEAFEDVPAYYATLAHECIHWTKPKHRLDRDLGAKRWGDHGYAAEELVAELGAAFLCADLDLTPQLRDEHASYLATWLEVLKEDSRAIFTAAAHAQKAADYLHGLKAPLRSVA